MKENFCSVLIVGALWGIAEATLGHFLHVFSLGIGWLVWFPIAYYFLNLIYRITKRPECMLFTAFLSALIKMINIIGAQRLDIVINPAASIILEALAVYTVYKFLLKEKNEVRLNLTYILTFGFLWRMLYICYVLCLPQYWISISVPERNNSVCEIPFP